MIYPTAESTVRASGVRKIPLPVHAMLILTTIGIADAAYVGAISSAYFIYLQLG